MQLTPDAVDAVFNACQSDDGDVEVDAIVATVKFDGAKLADYGESIVGLLMELPDEYRESVGGGWSFLNACMDRHGNQWTGLHMEMGKLFALGQGAGLVSCLVPRELWSALPGGVPYYMVKDKSLLRPVRKVTDS